MKFAKVIFLVFSVVAINSVQAQRKITIKSITSSKKKNILKKKKDPSTEELFHKQLKKKKRHFVGFGLGQTFLRSDFQDNGQNSITPDIHYDYEASHSFDFTTNLHFSRHKHQERYTQIFGLALGVKGKLFQFDYFSPYLMGGLGFYIPKLKRDSGEELQETKSQSVLGIHFGAGAELILNYKVKVGIFLHYHNPFDVKQDVGRKVEGSYYKLQMIGYYNPF